MQSCYRWIVWVLSVIFLLALAGSPQVQAQTPPEGTAFAWGYNFDGQLGNGTYDDAATPAPVIGLSNIVALAAGEEDSLALTSDGTVWVWGDNSDGELGNGTFTTTEPSGIATPAPVSGLSNIVAIAAGSGHCLALGSDGTVWAWGSNIYGELGNGTFATTSPYGIATPAPVSGLSNVVAIAAGDGYSLALRGDGTVWAWGENFDGELGNGTFMTTKPYGIATPGQVSGLSNVVAIAAGSDHNLVLGEPLRGVDVANGAGGISVLTWQMMKEVGWQFVITDAWMGHNPNTFAQVQLQNARMAGMQTAAYCYLNFDNGSRVSNAPANQTGTWQVQQALAQLGSEANYIAFLAIDVEDKFAGNMTPPQRAARVREAIYAAVDAGLFPILYTSRGNWTESTLMNNNRDSDIASLPLWDSRYASIKTDPNREETPFLAFNLDLGGPNGYPYGGWTQRSGKQYGYWNSANDASRTSVYLNDAFDLEADTDVFNPSLFYGPFPTLLFLSGNNVTVTAGSPVTPKGTLHLFVPPPASDATVTLTNSNPNLVTVPNTVLVPAGQHTVTFNINVSLPSPGGSATITATYAGISRVLTIPVIHAIPAPPHPIGAPAQPPPLH